METLQKVIEFLKDDTELAFKFVDGIRKWFDTVFPLLLKHEDVHVEHDALETMKKLFGMSFAEELIKVFNDSEKLHVDLKKIIVSSNPDFIKFSKVSEVSIECIEFLAATQNNSIEMLDIIKSVKEELCKMLEGEQYLMGSMIVSVTLNIK